jgi:hypothetical protein
MIAPNGTLARCPIRLSETHACRSPARRGRPRVRRRRGRVRQGDGAGNRPAVRTSPRTLIKEVFFHFHPRPQPQLYNSANQYLYDDGAVVDCSQGGTFRGRLGVGRYWRPKLAHTASGAFVGDALFPEEDGVCLDHRAFDGTLVRTYFTFTEAGKILHTACAS